MKYTFLLLVLLYSCATKPLSDEDKLKKVDAAILDIQINSDKAHNVYVSDTVSKETMYSLTFSVQISRRPGMSLLLEFLRNKDDVDDSVKWSKAIAKNKFAIGEEKLELVRSVLEAAVKRGIFEKTDDLLDCKTGKVISKSLEQDTVNFTFYPSFKTHGMLLRDTATTQQIADEKIAKFYSFVKEQAKSNIQGNLTGVLFAYSKIGKKVQSCNISLPQ